MMMILEQITITSTNMHMLCVSFRVMSRSTQFTRNTEHSIVTRVYFYTSLSYSDEEPTVRFLFFQPNNNYFRTPNRMKCCFFEEFNFFFACFFSHHNSVCAKTILLNSNIHKLKHSLTQTHTYMYLISLSSFSISFYLKCFVSRSTRRRRLWKKQGDFCSVPQLLSGCF